MTKSPKIILAAGVLLISYLVLIIGTVFVSQQRVREAVNEQLRLNIEKRATALSYFFSERRNDVAGLARDRAIEAYFANKALGMSLEYGLRASLQAVRETIAAVAREKRIGGNPIYERMTFFDIAGRVIADSSAEDSNAMPAWAPVNGHPPEVVLTSRAENDAPTIGVSAPVVFKGQIVGTLAGRIDVKLVLEQLVSKHEEDRTGRFVLIEPLSDSGLYLSDRRFGDMPPGPLRFQIADANADGIVNTRPLTIAASVAGTRFKLLEIFPAYGGEELVTSPWLLAAVAGIAIPVLAGLLYFLRLNNRNVALRTRLQEGRRHEGALVAHNATLRSEIERRLEIEGDLVRTTETLRQTVAELEKASLAKSEFLAKMSHELRTPLNAILGFSHCIATELFGPIAQKRYVEYGTHIHQSGEHLLDIINDILDLAKVEAGKKELFEAIVDVGDILATCLRTIESQASSKAIDLVLERPRALPGLWADGRLLTQILLNLLSNAVKFTAKGGRVRLAASFSAAGEMTFTVADTGIGMNPADLARAMEPFSQVHPLMTTPAEGTGLGLSLVKKFADLHEAAMSIESACGVGTTVVIRFPAHRTVADDHTELPKRIAG